MLLVCFILQQCGECGGVNIEKRHVSCDLMEIRKYISLELAYSEIRKTIKKISTTIKFL